jgi:hypothetical protein
MGGADEQKWIGPGDVTLAWVFTATTGAAVLASAWPIATRRAIPPYDPMVLLTGMTLVALIWTGFFARRAFIAQRDALRYQKAHDSESQHTERLSLRHAIGAEIARVVSRAEEILEGMELAPDKLYATFRLPSELYVALGARIGLLETADLMRTVAFYDQVAWLNSAPEVHSALDDRRTNEGGAASNLTVQRQESLEMEFERRLREIPNLGRGLCATLGYPVPEAVAGGGGGGGLHGTLCLAP